jgi:hypothetical protein
MRTPKLPSPSVFGAVFLAIALAGCGPGEGEVANSAAAVSVRAVDPGNAGGNKLLTVMSRNLYVGGDLFLPFDPATQDPLAAASQVFADVLASDVPARMQAIAAEISMARPDLVGLQEAFRIVVTPIGATAPVLLDLDFVSLVVDALAEMPGPAYRVVVEEEHTVLTLPLPADGVQVTIVDRDAILADADVVVRSAGGGDFAARFETSLAGIPVVLLRGWVEAVVKHQGVELTFVNTHLETKAFGPLQSLQANELADRFEGVEPLVVVGDMNSDPEDPPTVLPTPYAILTGFLTDVWPLVGDGAGLTCCFDADLTPPSRDLFERVDLVLFAGTITPLSAYRVGLDPLEALGGRWPSDHAGVVATLRLENPRFFATMSATMSP